MNPFDEMIQYNECIKPYLYRPIGGSMMDNGGNGCEKETKGMKGMKGKIITICGSMKFAEEMKMHERRLFQEGHIVLMPIITTEHKPFSDEEIKIYKKAHKEKIKMSDSIFVINKDGYVGRDTASEIEFASEMRKYIYFLENVSNEML